MRIELERLKEVGGNFSQVYAVGDLLLDDDIRLTEPTEVRGRIRREGDEVELRGELDTRVEALCGRCLKPVLFPIRLKFKERFVPAVSWRSEEQHELSEEDLDLAVFDGEAIEVDGLVREEILLAMPTHVLCADDCKGLCPACGIDKNLKSCDCPSGDIDLRWQGLSQLQS